MLRVHLNSKDTIKPSSPTPQNPGSYALSMIDRVMPPFYVDLLLFYSASDTTRHDQVEKANRLRDSLSKTLTIFYPLAGRIKRPEGLGFATEVELNSDDGVEFSVTRVDGDLDKVLMHPPMEELSRLLPETRETLEFGDPLLAVQFNMFDCGGSVLGISISHQVADAASLAMLLNCWSRIACGGDGHPHPIFDSASVFPPNRVKGLRPVCLDLKDIMNIQKRFIVKPSYMEKLRNDNYYGDRLQHPTRVEAVSTLVWRCVMRAREKEAPNFGRMLACHGVDMRKRMANPAGDSLFGNAISGVHLQPEEVGAEGDSWNDKRSQGLLEKRLRDNLSLANGYDYVVAMVEKSLESRQEVRRRDALVFSSWCRFPFYKTDFGWGEPVWLSYPGKTGIDTVLLIDTKEEGGMEIWVCLPDEEMRWFEKDPELLEFALKC